VADSCWGWESATSKPEFEALGAPFDHRAGRTMDYLAAMRAIWAGESSFTGRFFSYSGVRAEPRPISVPLHFGGYTAAAIQRAAEHGQGWIGYDLDVTQTRDYVARLPAGLEISVTPSRRVLLDSASVEEFAALGVTRLVLRPPGDPAELHRFVEEIPMSLAG
jgi:alkanesulfonate monooxygenase SsuD/methylene tetrahydromethanopterin reductase-like flavin-dependent oxidoreductase (luciferase family)